jgi:hypothetical protein
MNEPPFMEHPTGEFETAVDAMEAAVRRLRALPSREEWITFSAQGQGSRPDSYEFAEIRMKADTLEVGPDPLNVAQILQLAEAECSLSPVSDNCYSVESSTPMQAALIFDAIFRYHFGIRPFPDEGDDYAVGAEW